MHRCTVKINIYGRAHITISFSSQQFEALYHDDFRAVTGIYQPRPSKYKDDIDQKNNIDGIDRNNDMDGKDWWNITGARIWMKNNSV